MATARGCDSKRAKLNSTRLPSRTPNATFGGPYIQSTITALRLHHMRPAIIHLPITLLLLAVGADLLGCIIRGKSLHSFGEKAIVLGAAGAGAVAVTSLIAGEKSTSKTVHATC